MKHGEGQALALQPKDRTCVGSRLESAPTVMGQPLALQPKDSPPKSERGTGAPYGFKDSTAYARKSGTGTGIPPFARDSSETNPGTVKSIAV